MFRDGEALPGDGRGAARGQAGVCQCRCPWAPRVDPAEGRGTYLLRRVLAGSGELPSDWSGPAEVAVEDAAALDIPALDIPALDTSALDIPASDTSALDILASDTSSLRHAVRLPARVGRTAPWPEWVPAPVRDTFVDHGVRAPWTHQVRAAELAHAGQDVVVATGTASGKSLAYQLPVLTALAADPRAVALYLSPTKALGRRPAACARRARPAGRQGRPAGRRHLPRRA